MGWGRGRAKLGWCAVGQGRVGGLWVTGFVQKHENKIPGLFQDNSRIFFSFQGLNFIDFQSIFVCFCQKRRFGNMLHFISITGIFSLWYG